MPPTTKAMLRCLILGAAGGVAGLILFAAPAYADDEPQRPGGALGAVVEVVDQVLPDVEPTKARAPDPEPEPTKDPEPAAEPEPADEPTHGTDGHEQQAADEPTDKPEPEPANPIGAVLDSVEQVVTPVVEAVKPVVEAVAPTPTPAPVVTPVPAPVATQPSPPPSAPAITTVDTTTPAPTNAPEQPAAAEPAAEVAGLPVVGPVAGSNTLLPGLTPAPVADAAARRPRAPQCDGHVHTLDQVRDAIRSLVAEQQGRTPVRADQRGPARPCPDQPAGPVLQAGGPSAATLTARDQHPHPVADVTTVTPDGDPASLRQLRARSTIPTGRAPHVDPGPA